MPLSATAIAESFGWALRTDMRNERFAALRLATALGATKKAAENWTYGVHSPPLHQVIAIAARRPAIKAALLELIREAEEQLGNVEMVEGTAGAGCNGAGDGERNYSAADERDCGSTKRDHGTARKG